MFNNAEVGVIEGEPVLPLILLKEASKARVAAYKKAIEDAAKAAAVAAEDTLVEPSKLIKLDLDNKNNSDNNTYAAFKYIKTIKVENKGDSIPSPVDSGATISIRISQ